MIQSEILNNTQWKKAAERKKNYDTLLGHRYRVNSTCMERFLHRLQSRKSKTKLQLKKNLPKNRYYKTEMKASENVNNPSRNRI